MNSGTFIARHRRLIICGVNAAVFVIGWALAIWWERYGRLRPLDGILVAVAAGMTFGQFLVLAFYVALHARPAPRRWLLALALIAGASLAYCTMSLLFELRWLASRWLDPTYVLFTQLAFLLSLIAVGMLLLILMRLAMWPWRRLFGWRIEWEDQAAIGDTRQFSLAEIFFITAGVAVSCTLARALFDAMLTVPLVYGAILLAGALPTFVATFVLSAGCGRWQNWSVLLVWSCLVSLALTPLVAWVHNELGLLNQWIGGWMILLPWSPRALAIAAAFTLAVAFSGRLNWLALARLGLRCRAGLNHALVPATAIDTVDSPARLTPPAPPR